MPEYQFHTLDVFTKEKFSGNPLAVVLDADSLNTDEMQTIAREFNLSETIFVRTPENSSNTASVRIFFPTAEIPFAGHPTVGCAILLAEMQNPGSGDFSADITLEEVAGLVPVKVTRTNGTVNAQFEAPVVPYAVGGSHIPNELIANALGIQANQIGFDQHQPGIHEGGPRFFYVPLNDPSALETVKPIEPFWSEMTGKTGSGGVYMYRRDGDQAYRARMMAPTNGIPEDPATGSASAIFASQLLQAGELQASFTKIRLSQGVEMGRPSDIHLEIDCAGDVITSVRVSGYAVRVSEGKISV